MSRRTTPPTRTGRRAQRRSPRPRPAASSRKEGRALAPAIFLLRPRRGPAPAPCHRRWGSGARSVTTLCRPRLNAPAGRPPQGPAAFPTPHVHVLPNHSAHVLPDHPEVCHEVAKAVAAALIPLLWFRVHCQSNACAAARRAGLTRAHTRPAGLSRAPAAPQALTTGGGGLLSPPLPLNRKT